MSEQPYQQFAGPQLQRSPWLANLYLVWQRIKQKRYQKNNKQNMTPNIKSNLTI